MRGIPTTARVRGSDLEVSKVFENGNHSFLELNMDNLLQVMVRRGAPLVR